MTHPRQAAAYGSGVTTGPVVNSVTHSVGAGSLQSGPAKNRDSQRAGLAFFCFPTPTAVSQTITVTYNLSQTNDHIEVYEVVNGYAADLFGNTTFGQSSSNSRALSLAQTENVNSAIVAALCAETAAATATITGSEFTPATDFLNATTRVRDSFKTAATIGTYAETFTISATTQNVGVIVEINGA